MKKRKLKKDVVEFVNFTPGIAEIYPIIKAENYKRAWLKEAGKDIVEMNEKIKTCPIDKLRDATNSVCRSITRCPGIRDYMRYGYLLQAPFDFTIETYGDGEKFEWAALTPNMNNFAKIVGHPPEQLNKYSALPSNTLKTILKFSSSWNVLPSEKYVYIVMNPFYNNEPRFTTLSGILDPYIDTQMNVFMMWHVLKGRETIKAGTPLAQFLPIPRGSVTPELSCRSAEPQDREKLMRAGNILHLSTVRDLDNVKAAMKKIFK